MVDLNAPIDDIHAMCQQAVREVRTEFMKAKRSIMRREFGECPPPPTRGTHSAAVWLDEGDAVFLTRESLYEGDDPILRRPWFR